MKLKMIPPSNVKGNQMKTYLETHLARVLREAASLEEAHVIDFQSQTHHVRLTLQVAAGRKDERRLRSITSKWVERGHVGNISLVQPTPAILLTPLTSFSHQGITVHPTSQIHASEDFALSCTTSFANSDAVSAASFRWFKDDLFINVTAPTSGKSAHVIEDDAARDQYVSQLNIKNASPLDQGTFTCQAIESGHQRCYTRRVEVRAPPRVWIEPMSLTVRKGENFTIKCFSASTNPNDAKYTYSWTKNKELLPIKTDTEHYEVLFPMGSILQVSTISKSTMFSCLVQDSAVWAEQSILVNVIDSELIKTCAGERHLKLLWPETAPGTESLQECPVGYAGVARRACNLRETGHPVWYLPDFAGCHSDRMEALNLQFQKVRLGYAATRPLDVLRGYRRYLNGNRTLLPGEGYTVLQLVNDVVHYINNSISGDVYDTVFDIVEGILQRKLSLINETQVMLLQEVVKRQSLAFQSTFHRTLNTIDVTLTRPDKTGFHVPQSGLRYPGWFSYKLHLALPRHYFAAAAGVGAASPNKSATLAAVVYRNLSAFLPLRSAIRLKDGIEMDYEVISNIVGCWLTFNGSELRENLTDILYTMEFQHPGKNASQDAWNVQCAVADYASYGYAWNTQTCITRLLEATRTRCICPRSGTYAVLLTMKPSFIDSEEAPSRQLVILVGCASCSLLNAIAVVILVCYWLRRRSCLVFLKLQCCLSLLASMLVFIYALWDDLPPALFLTVMSILESFLLTGLSSQLSNLLIIYSELVQLPRMRSVKQTVVLIITGAPMIAVLVITWPI
ncbi:adhesion G protein-coupled receptor B3-like [Atheta coriaria]|uniref:adhesion G protein-coupled receptor B3-like n=1 Tax=Dalotia coriaria TaxID=877792 RepID=UPI0031F3E831